MTLTYPGSRISSSGQCKMCRGFPGNFQDCGLVSLKMDDGQEVKLLRWTCNYCGYTMLFDPSMARQTAYRGEGEEVFPDFNGS